MPLGILLWMREDLFSRLGREVIREGILVVVLLVAGAAQASWDIPSAQAATGEGF